MISHSVLKLLNYTKFILHKISSAYAVRCSGSSEYPVSLLVSVLGIPRHSISLAAYAFLSALAASDLEKRAKALRKRTGIN